MSWVSVNAHFDYLQLVAIYQSRWRHKPEDPRITQSAVLHVLGKSEGRFLFYVFFLLPFYISFLNPGTSRLSVSHKGLYSGAILLIHLPLLLSQKRRETTGTIITPKLKSFTAIRFRNVEIIVEGIC